MVRRNFAILSYAYRSNSPLTATFFIYADSDYTIFAWRQRQLEEMTGAQPIVSTSTPVPENGGLPGPTLHLHDPSKPLPTPGRYLNPSYYMFSRSGAYDSARTIAPSAHTRAKSVRSTKSRRMSVIEDDDGLKRREYTRANANSGPWNRGTHILTKRRLRPSFWHTIGRRGQRRRAGSMCLHRAS